MQNQEEEELKERTIFIDGSSNKYVNGIGLILIGPKGKRIKYALCLQFLVTNNAAKYKTLILSLEPAKEVVA